MSAMEGKEKYEHEIEKQIHDRIQQKVESEEINFENLGLSFPNNYRENLSQFNTWKKNEEIYIDRVTKDVFALVKRNLSTYTPETIDTVIEKVFSDPTSSYTQTTYCTDDNFIIRNKSQTGMCLSGKKIKCHSLFDDGASLRNRDGCEEM
jgi:hypothetical protein